VERRVLRRLAELSALYAGRDSVIPLTQEQLAEMAGMSRATVNRVLREEQGRRGTVELRRGRTSVLDAEAIACRVR
jgi:CRP/FNR family transcriptional regulator, cyclic AMP receptor protein